MKVLEERKKQILQAIIDEYISTAEPVSSGALVNRHGLNCSSATIRNEMAELEKAGYLDKPHTSSGRIPSAQGYRFYVDELLNDENISLEEIQYIRENLQTKVNEIEDLTKKPVVGVIPMEDIVLDDEDSLSTQLSCKHAMTGVDVAIIRFPHISNFTDFLALRYQDGISVRYVERKEELGAPDYIILPGTKNTMADLKWLRESGLEGAILRQKNRVKLFGICGGFQMLGTELSDPECVEHGGRMRGMGLLDFSTTFLKEKTRTRMDGEVTDKTSSLLHLGICDNNGNQKEDRIKGYEIHMGTTIYGEHGIPFAKLMDGRMDGCVNEDGTVVGTYLHGIFDNETFVRQYFKIEDSKTEQTFEEFKQTQYDKLADLIRNSLDMETIYEILKGTSSMEHKESMEYKKPKEEKEN